MMLVKRILYKKIQKVFYRNNDKFARFRASNKGLIKRTVSKLYNPGWDNLPGKTKLALLNKYGEFEYILKRAPNIFEEKPLKTKLLNEPERKNFILIIPLYSEDNKKRSSEFLECLDINLAHKRIGKIIIFYDTKKSIEEDFFYKKLKKRGVEIIMKKGRLSYKEAFVYANNNFPDSNIIVANADIYFNETLKKLDLIDMHNTFFSLTRWNVAYADNLQISCIKQCEAASTISQDAWIFKTPLTIDFECDFKLGLIHCDSFLNNRMRQESSLDIMNPCLDVQICHLHKSEYRSIDLLKLIRRRKEYYLEQTALGNRDAGVKWSYLIDKNS